MQARALLYKNIREYFFSKEVLEVDTPLLAKYGVTDVNLVNFISNWSLPGSKKTQLFLQTSPEYAMKRLLAANYGDIYQICKAFRNEEVGAIHQPEYTILEWYRLGYDHHALMDDLVNLFACLGLFSDVVKLSYRQLFQQYLCIDPYKESVEALKLVATDQNLGVSSIEAQGGLSRDGWLNILLTHIIEPKLINVPMVLVYDYPSSQAALSVVRKETPAVASRFEVYVYGVECANGFHELTDANEQLLRFKSDNKVRKSLGLPEVPVDDLLISAMQAGIPDCAGVAVGVDRLLALSLGYRDISSVLAFPFLK